MPLALGVLSQACMYGACHLSIKLTQVDFFVILAHLAQIERSETGREQMTTVLAFSKF